jgi:enoyl-CoA hydratase/carnithine racemase
LYSNVLELALDLASKLKNNSIKSMEMTKNIIRTISGLTVEEAVEYCIGLNTISRTTEDFKNGLNNFLTKK